MRRGEYLQLKKWIKNLFLLFLVFGFLTSMFNNDNKDTTSDKIPDFENTDEMINPTGIQLNKEEIFF